jgi:hypothetical protein
MRWNPHRRDAVRILFVWVKPSGLVHSSTFLSMFWKYFVIILAATCMHFVEVFFIFVGPVGWTCNISVRPRLFHIIPLSPSFRLAEAFFEPDLFRYKYPNILNPSYSSYLPAYEDGTDNVFRSVGIQNSDAGELARRKHTACRTRRKFEIETIPFRVFFGEFAMFWKTTGSFMFVRPHMSTLLPLAEFPRNLILGAFIEMCREKISSVKIGPGWERGTQNFTSILK